ncbi:MAG TPA: flagellar protein FlaG [Methylophilus sp.]
MFKPSLDGYGKVNLPGAVSNVMSSQNIQAVAGLKVVAKPEVAAPNAAEVDEAALTSAVKKLNDYVAPALQTIQFSIDQESDRVVVKVVDTATQKVLRQIPNEEVMAITKTLDKLQGLVIRQTA